MTDVLITQANGGAWSFAKGDAAGDNALVARFHDLAFLVEGGPGGATQLAASRPGVFSVSPSVGSGIAPNGFFCTASGSGMGITVYAGAAVVERGSFSGAAWSTFTPLYTGPYLVQMRSNGTAAASAADTTSTRIDRLDLQIMDGPGYGDNSGVSYAKVIYTRGTAGSGTAPNAPANSIPLSWITIPANTTTLTSGMFTDKRTSTAPRGAVRVLLPGDDNTQSGVCHAELRDTTFNKISGSLVGTIDRWDANTTTWRTLAPTSPLIAELFQSSTQSVNPAAWTKINLQSTRFDPSGIGSTANSRITPGLPGFYEFSYDLSWTVGAGANGNNFAALYRNGAVENGSGRSATFYNVTAGANGFGANGSKTVQVTNSTDYFELWAYQSNAGAVSTYQDGVNKCSLAVKYISGL